MEEVHRVMRLKGYSHTILNQCAGVMLAASILVLLCSMRAGSYAASIPVSPTSTPPISVLSQSDAILYREIFALQQAGDIKAAARKIQALQNDLLMGHVLSQKYLHPTAWRSSFAELSSWLKRYYDHPAASRIKWLSNRRKPKSVKAARNPKAGYLNGVGLSKPQSFRATIPESWKGRSAPKKTAAIARQVRRSIRRGHPSGAVEYLNKLSILRYLTASEEAHLRGEIAHAYLFLV